MNVRRTEMNDLTEILQIYSYAKEQMKKNGNPTQWKENYPSIQILSKDIEDRNSYVIKENGVIYAVFTFIIGIEPTYQKIEGQWVNEDSYGTIHRIASAGIRKGMMKECLDYCEKFVSNLRIDTHKNNLIMQHLLEQYGFVPCGIIYVADGSPRIAYQKVLA